MKISLYKFVTTFCLVPVNDWLAFVQRVTGRLLLGWLFFRLFNLLTKPLFIMALIGLLIWSPDTIAWIFIKLGGIELRVFMIALNAIMPDIFATAGGNYASWGEIWRAGLNALPTQMVEVMNGIGVSQILGLITSTIGAVGTIRIYRKVMLRAGLL